MRITIVVPVLDEEASVGVFYENVRASLSSLNADIEIIFVDDGSNDATAEIISRIAERDCNVVLIELTRNFGKEAALFAGLCHSTGDAVIPMDVDLQDPIEVIPLMIAKWQAGADIVLAKRIDRTSDGFFKRKTASIFYSLHNKLSALRLEENVGDFRLISRPILQHIIAMPERQLFMKGILSWAGGVTEIVEYTRPKRVAGTTKFNTWKLWNLAIEGFVNFSTLPLRVWTYVGAAIAFSSIANSLWIIFKKLTWGIEAEGYASLITSITLLGGVQLIGIGIIGEYVGRIYSEVKQRPRYIIRRSINFNKQF